MAKKVMLMILVIIFVSFHQIEAKGGRGGGGKSGGRGGGRGGSGGRRGFGGKNRGYVGKGVLSRFNRYPGLESYSYSSSFNGFGMGLGAGMYASQRAFLVFEENLGQHRSVQDGNSNKKINTTRCYSTTYTAFIKNYEYFEPEEIYLEEGNETCSSVDDVCMGHLSLIKFGISTTASENIDGVKVSLVKGCESLEKIRNLTMTWSENSTCFTSNKTVRNYYSMEKLELKDSLKNRGVRIPLKTPRTREEMDAYLEIRERQMNELNKLHESLRTALVMNLTELYETFKIQGEVEIFYEIDQSEICYCRGDLCNTAARCVLRPIALIICILAQICWSSVLKKYNNHHQRFIQA